MSDFDTIWFGAAFDCPTCGEPIKSVQLSELRKEFEEPEKRRGDIFIGDCVSHSEDVRIIKKELFCGLCSKNYTEKYVFFPIFMGILIGVTESLESATKMLTKMVSIERLSSLYHDLYRKYKEELGIKQQHISFLVDFLKKYKEGITQPDQYNRPENSNYFKDTDPLVAIDKYLDIVWGNKREKI